MNNLLTSMEIHLFVAIMVSYNKEVIVEDIKRGGVLNITTIIL